IRERGGDVGAVVNADRRRGAQRGDAEGHGDAVIAVGPDVAAADRAAVDDDAVRGRFGLYAQRLQTIGHDLNAVGFLDAQLLGATQHGAPFGAGGGDEQHREFVDGQRHQVLGNVDALELGRAYAQVGHRLAADFTRVLQGDVTAHQLENLDHAGAGRVDTHVLQYQLGAFGDAGRHQEERGGGNVRRH